MERLLGRASANDESEWISVSDLMAGLMVIFLFIAIVYIRPLILQREEAVAEKEQLVAAQQTVREIVVAWRQSEIGIHQALEAEFRDDLARWNAEIDEPTLTFRFKAPDVLFDRNEARLKPMFRAILSDFFPRYLGLLTDFRDVIEEVRIEGHTSSEWNPGTGPLEAYFKNMELSQTRTRAVLEYVLGPEAVRPHRDWSIAYVTANGLSSSRLIRNREGGRESVRVSTRRVPGADQGAGADRHHPGDHTVKLEIDFSALDDQMRRMGATETTWSSGKPPPGPIGGISSGLEKKEGIEIEEITDVRAAHGGLLTYKGEQILLYIKDTRSNLATLMHRPEMSRRYHVAECSKLRQMRAVGRIDRYVVTTRTDGKFVAEWADRESGERGEVEAALKVCMNCLEVLNWEGYAKVGRQERRKIWSGFDISHFLREHVAFFHSRPSGVAEAGGGYAVDWSVISERIRRRRGWRCEQCQVVLADHRQLLHCHHRNGVKSDNSPANLQVLCVLCHAAAPLHAHMRVTPKEKALIESLRPR